jgi:hypothetical protein
MARRYVRDDADLPDHDFILHLSGLSCHVRHFERGGDHVVIVGEFAGGASPVLLAEPIARELLAQPLAPPGHDLTMIGYAPQPPLSGKPHFREVTFEVDGTARRPSAAQFARPERSTACFRPLDLDAVEALVGRPVFTFPYGFYTRELAEAMNGQPAKRLLELLTEAGLACPEHGPSPHGEYCGVDPGCDALRNRRMRRWRAPYVPRRRASGGAYVGTDSGRRSRVVFDDEWGHSTVPVLGFDAPEMGWGYGGAGAWEAATSILADYLGFLPWPALAARFKDEVIAKLPGEGFVLAGEAFDAWHDEAAATLRRGLVVVAGPSSLTWSTGAVNPLAVAIGLALNEAGFDVYEQGTNAEASYSRRSDHRLHGMLHESLLRALDCCSMLVVPHDGHALVPAAECSAALTYAFAHPDVPCLVAHQHADAELLADYARFGFDAAPVHGVLPHEVAGVVDAVDRACAAYECLRPPSGPRSAAAT